MTPTEQRVKDLIESWLTSIDLHLQYAELNDSAYNKVQPWPVHDRPSKWVLEMTRQKVAELQSALEWRIAMGDAQFAETLEQAITLANLVGLQNLKRFIPLAKPDQHGRAIPGALDDLDPLMPRRTPAPAPLPPAAAASPPPAPQPTPLSAPAPMPPPPAQPTITAAPKPAPASPPPAPRPAAPAQASAVASRPVAAPAVQPAAPPLAQQTSPASKPAAVSAPRPAPPPAVERAVEIEATREMPRLQRPPASAAPAATPTPQPAPKPVPAAPKAEPAPPPETDSKTLQMVMDDAIRLINWGRPWHELPEAVARLADRPKASEVRRILRTHRQEIEKRAKEEAEAEQDKKKKKKR